MRKFLIGFLCIFFSVAIVMGVPADNAVTDRSKAGLFSQRVLSMSKQPQKVYVLYQNGNLIGILHNKEKLEKHLRELYREKYADTFPSSSLHLAAGLNLNDEYSPCQWSDADDDIIDWLDSQDAYALDAQEIAFSNDDGIYARIYVSDISLYQNALKKYLSYFVDSRFIDDLLAGRTVSMPDDYGSADTGAAIAETVTTLAAAAPADDIFTTEEQVLEYLSYGGNTNKTWYTVEAGDTLEGVGEKNGGLSKEQLVNINSDILKSTQDVLVPGEKLCVTYFESPVTIQVSRARLVNEPIPFKTDYVQNMTACGDREVIQAGADGAQNVLYQETWTNGVLSAVTRSSSLQTMKPVNQVRAVNSDEDRAAGSGTIQMPVDHAEISCEWGCRLNYEAVSLQNAYDFWGNVYAADNGIVVETGNNEEKGNWIRIDHRNGIYSLYAHLQETNIVPAGTIVQKGDTIGQIGISGNSSYPHLEFWLEDENGNHLNPETAAGFSARNE